MSDIRTGQHKDFAPPVEEGHVFEFADEAGDIQSLEFLGMLIHEEEHFAFFFPIEQDSQVGDSGEVIILRVDEVDDEGQPAAFSAVESDALAQAVYEHFREATQDIYRFE